jgi:tagatose kinase
MDILTIGGILVEIMRTDLDQPLDQPATLVGPFPSGDVPIFINAAAKLGGDSALIGVVGDDQFGACHKRKMQQSGVDTTYVRVQKGATTGTAFVSYFSDGSREFIYHWRHAAAGMLNESDVENADLSDVKWVHITGITLAVNDGCKKAVYKLLSKIPSSAKVSFDPNIRPELLSVDQIREMCKPVIERADIIFPSLTEAMMFTGDASDDEGCKRWAKSGKLVVLKMGEEGSRVFDGDNIIDVPTFKVEEVDPTGAGDSFCAGFIIALNEGKDLYDAALFANAVGALSVTKKGPMDGACTKEEALAFIAKNKK